MGRPKKKVPITHQFTQVEMDEIKRIIGVLEQFYEAACSYMDSPSEDDQETFGGLVVARARVAENLESVDP